MYRIVFQNIHPSIILMMINMSTSMDFDGQQVDDEGVIGTL
jgi:hypothetical protein